MKPARETNSMSRPRMKTGHRNERMHSLSGLEASQMPADIIGMAQRRAMKLRVAVILLLTPMVWDWTNLEEGREGRVWEGGLDWMDSGMG